VELVVDVMDIKSAGMFAMLMADLVQKNILDEGLREWLRPGFSASTEDDEIVASVLLGGDEAVLHVRVANLRLCVAITNHLN